MPDQAQWICDPLTKKNHLHTSTDSSNIGISGFLYNLIGRDHFGQ